jgi:hypothetical protein
VGGTLLCTGLIARTETANSVTVNSSDVLASSLASLATIPVTRETVKGGASDHTAQISGTCTEKDPWHAPDLDADAGSGPDRRRYVLEYSTHPVAR